MDLTKKLKIINCALRLFNMNVAQDIDRAMLPILVISYDFFWWGKIFATERSMQQFQSVICEKIFLDM